MDWYSGDYDDEVYVSLMTEDGILLDYAEHGDPLFFQAGPDCDADNEGINDCEVTITFYDSYNDGWNGAEVDIYTGGLFWGTFTLEDGLISVSNTFPIIKAKNCSWIGIPETTMMKFHLNWKTKMGMSSIRACLGTRSMKWPRMRAASVM